MSDISNSTNCSSKRRLYQIDNTIEYLTQELNTLNGFVYKTEFECSLMTVKMKREKLRALSAVAKTQVLLTNIEVMIAESDLSTDIERLRNFKRRKLNRNEGESQVLAPTPPQVTPPPTTTTVSVQTTESISKKKKKTRRSSCRRKSPGDISSDDTLIIPSIQKSSLESIASLGEPSQKFQTNLSIGLFTPTPATISDSEISLSNSIKAEFNEPYTKTLTQEPVKKSPAKKHKSEKKVESKSKSKHFTKHTQSPPGFQKTVADLRKCANTPTNHMNSGSSSSDSKTGDKKSTPHATVTCAPVRHNMGILLTQPSTSTASPYLYVNPATQNNTQHHSQKAGTSHSYNFYGSKP